MSTGHVSELNAFNLAVMAKDAAAVRIQDALDKFRDAGFDRFQRQPENLDWMSDQTALLYACLNDGRGVLDALDGLVVAGRAAVAAPLCRPQPDAIAAMDIAVDRLASTEAAALAAFGVLDATVRQLVASMQTADTQARIAGFVSDTLQALTLAAEQLETYQDAADDVVVTAGAAIGTMEQQCPEVVPPECVAALPAFDIALEALIHAVHEQEVTPALFEADCEQRFSAHPELLAWSRPIFAAMRERLHGNGGIFDLVDGLVTAAADAFEGLGVSWREGHGLTAAAVAKSGDITSAFLNARASQRRAVQGLGG